jgi:geranylgeranyl pyrophosphate synthase
MIGGQILDLTAEGQEPSLGLVREIHLRKTAALIGAAGAMGGIAARAGAETMVVLRRYGELLGLAFQVMDDILDETATAEELGKKTRKDHERGKLTYPAALGLDASRRAAHAMIEEAAEIVRPLDRNGDLEVIARFVIARTA